ncbi:MAG: HIT family protein [Candidatus Eiseniibacteriota bacterium]
MSGRDERQDTPLQRLWATWRMKYVSALGADEGACVFCEIPKLRDGPGNLVLHRGMSAYIVLNLYPYNNGHAMVVPFRHVDTLAGLSDEERSEMMKLAAVMETALAERVRAQGFNLGMNLGRAGGAGIPGHVHLHLVPRWPGDTNFMPVIGETKVMPEALEDTWANLEAAVRDVLKRDGRGS